jgi:hypothetical protein
LPLPQNPPRCAGRISGICEDFARLSGGTAIEFVAAVIIALLS